MKKKESLNRQTICPACTLLCDDIEVSGVGQEAIARQACAKGQAFFEVETVASKQASIDGQRATQDEAIFVAAKILCEAKAPLVCGLEHFSTEAQQVAWKIAERVGASVDSTMSNNDRASMFALQRRGKVTATIGEIGHRSDLVVFWFCNPVKTHPRLMERLATEGAPTNRKLIVINDEENGTSKAADSFIRIERWNAPAFLASVRARLLDLNCRQPDDGTIGFADELKAAKYGSIFHGQVSDDSSFDLAADSLNSMISKLNDHTRFVGMKLRKDSNAQSAENVLAWSSGFPFAINLARKFPRFNGLEHSAETVLARGECDAVLFGTGVDLKSAFSGLSRSAQNHFGSIPKIALSPISGFQSDVCFQTGVLGINESGEFCRNDDVSMPIRSGNGSMVLDLLQKLHVECVSKLGRSH